MVFDGFPPNNIWLICNGLYNRKFKPIDIPLRKVKQITSLYHDKLETIYRMHWKQINQARYGHTQNKVCFQYKQSSAY